MRALILAAALAACTTTSQAQSVSADPVIAAERAFAAEAAQIGWAEAFRRWHAPGAITLSPGPVDAAEGLAQIDGPGETTLDWRPAYAGVSRGGDFGFTTGPFQIRGRDGIIGHYFTVWRRQPNGDWRWIFDAGTDVADPGPAIANDAVLPALPVAASGAASADAAVEAVRSIEEGGDFGAARWLAEDARVNRPGAAAGVGRDAAAALIAADGPTVLTPIRREGAPAGDMVFSLGEARRGDRRGYYARIWQHRPEGWRIVFDEIVPHRGPPPG
ncbi:MAG: hypothetical protein AB7J28_14580 [Hyphomonadaceae bacterium]